MDDAAIYQASARNSKGIVSCSGVLEVGSMSEYKIHQRFFAKLKQKAELKRRELENSYCQEKENILQEQWSSRQNNVRWNDGLVHKSSSVQVEDDSEANEGEIIEEQPVSLNEELNRFSLKVHRYPVKSDRNQENGSQHMTLDVGQKNGNQELIYGSEKVEIGGTIPSTRKKANRNNITISNGFDEAFTTQSSQDTRESKKTHEGMSLANIFLESLQLKFGEEHHKNIKKQSQEITSTKASTIQEREEDVDTEEKKMKAEGRNQEWESCWEREQERSLEEEQENVREPEPEHRALAASEAKIPVYKEPEYQHKSALSSVFHSLKDIFFGKSKKSPEITDSSTKVSDINVEKKILAVNTKEHCHVPQTQPQKYETTSGVFGTMPDQLVPLSVNQQNQIGTLHVNAPFFQETPSIHIKTAMENLNLDNHIHGFTTNYIKDISKASQIHHECLEEEKKPGPEELQKNTLLTVCEVSIFLLLLYINFSVHYGYAFQNTSQI